MSVTGSATSTNDLKVLKGKISSLSAYALDQTLSVSGSAADAKAVGDALEKKVSFTDIVDNLNTNDANLPLSAKQGVEIKKSFNELRVSMDESVASMNQSVNELSQTANSANNTATNAYNMAENAQMTAESKMAADGSVAMEADFDMGENKIINVLSPDNPSDAANKEYVDSKRIAATVSLKSTGWATTTGEAPYTQAVAVAAILATDTPHWGVVYSDSDSLRKEEKVAYSLVDDMETDDGSVTFTCFEERPATDLTIQMEVNR